MESVNRKEVRFVMTINGSGRGINILYNKKR